MAAGGASIDARTRAPSVLWCKGYRPDLYWIELPGALDARAELVHRSDRRPIAHHALQVCCDALQAMMLMT